MSDPFAFFKKLDLKRPSVVSKPPPVQKTVDDFVPYLEELRDEAKGDPGLMLQMLYDKKEEIERARNFRYNLGLGSQAGRLKKTKNVSVFGNVYNVTSAKPSPEIYNDVRSLSELPIEPNEVAYFTYLINDDGLHVGRFRDSFEVGVGHEQLSMGGKSIDTIGVNILVAGELRILNDTLEFNFESGTFSKELHLEKYPLFKRFLIKYVSDVLNRDRIFSSIVYTDRVLFPITFPKLDKIRRDCDTGASIIANYRSGEIEDFCENVRFGDLEGAIRYFSRNPWEHVYLEKDGEIYHNPDALRPNHFVLVGPTKKARAVKAKVESAPRRSARLSGSARESSLLSMSGRRRSRSGGRRRRSRRSINRRYLENRRRLESILKK